MLLLILILSVLIFASPALAVTISISNIPSGVSDQPFSFNVSVSGASAGTNYLRMDLYKEGTTNYFGETYNGISYYNGTDGKQFSPTTIVSGQVWSGSIQGKIGSPTQSEYSGSGTYKLKIRRYTSSGNLASSDTQTPQDITITYSAPTPTSTPSPTPSPSSSSSTSSSSSFTISNIPSEIDSTQSFQASIKLSLSDNPDTKFFLKGAFKKPESSNYFGQTEVDGNWIKNNSEFSNQLSVTTDSSGNWSGNLDIQIDAFDSGYDGSGDYIFKVARYSSSGSGPVWSNEKDIKINAKEVSETETADEEIGVINLSKSASKSPEVLAVSTESEEKEEESYSLEKYQKVSTQTAIPLSFEEIKVKSNKTINPFVILGGIFILGAIGFSVYTRYGFSLKSILDEIHKLF